MQKNRKNLWWNLEKMPKNGFLLRMIQFFENLYFTEFTCNFRLRYWIVTIFCTLQQHLETHLCLYSSFIGRLDDEKFFTERKKYGIFNPFFLSSQRFCTFSKKFKTFRPKRIALWGRRPKPAYFLQNFMLFPTVITRLPENA